MRFSGRVSGNRMTGTVSGGNLPERSWRATRGQGASSTSARPAPAPRDVARSR
jgi:hypothetical protein